MKRILFIITIFLVIIAISFGLLYYFRDPDWSYVYADGGYIPLIEDNDSVEIEIEADYRVNKITNRNGDVIINIFGKDIDAYLSRDAGVINDVKFSSILPGERVHISLSFDNSKVTVFEEMLCSYVGTSKFCTKELNLISWEIDEYVDDINSKQNMR